jgi:hypothetical protein
MAALGRLEQLVLGSYGQSKYCYEKEDIHCQILISAQ